MFKHVLLSVCLLAALTATGQKVQNRGFYGNGPANAGGGLGFTDADVTRMVDAMCDKMGTVSHYRVESSPKVSNCQADLDDRGKPVIYFNAEFLKGVKGLDFTLTTLPTNDPQDWKTLTIMAHELGHHVGQHLLNRDLPPKQLELEADVFAGHMMHLLGATLEQAQAVMYDPSVPEKEGEYPARSKRLEAIKQGWDKVKIDGNDDATVKRELEAADKAFNADNYVEAFPILDKYKYHRLFTAHYQVELAYSYDEGLGTTANKPLAVVWYTKSAEGGNSDAQGNLGIMYSKGDGVAAPDYNKARYWWEKASDKGNHIGQCGLGWLYENGYGGLAKDEKAAFELYKKAAESGEITAQRNLGFMYENGRGVAKDIFQALIWYRKSAAQGYKKAQEDCTRLGSSW